MANIYFELTEAFNAQGPIAALSGAGSERPAVRAAIAGDRRATVVALAEEIDAMQRTDRARCGDYARAAEPYLTACRAAEAADLPLRETHRTLCDLAERLLPLHPAGAGDAAVE